MKELAEVITETVKDTIKERFSNPTTAAKEKLIGELKARIEELEAEIAKVNRNMGAP